MATAKKQKGGAPASAASKPVRQRKKPPKAVRSAVFMAKRAAAQQAVHADITQRRLDIVKEYSGVGRPPVDVPFTVELNEKLFALLATGSSLDTISNLDGMPSLYTLLRWLADKTHPFSETYTRAKALVVPLYEERAFEAAAQPNLCDVVTVRHSDKEGEVREVRTIDNVERSKLKFGAYQWTLGHLMPKKHGRHADPEVGKPNDQLKALFNSLKAGPKE